MLQKERRCAPLPGHDGCMWKLAAFCWCCACRWFFLAIDAVALQLHANALTTCAAHAQASPCSAKPMPQTRALSSTQPYKRCSLTALLIPLRKPRRLAVNLLAGIAL